MSGLSLHLGVTKEFDLRPGLKTIEVIPDQGNLNPFYTCHGLGLGITYQAQRLSKRLRAEFVG